MLKTMTQSETPGGAVASLLQKHKREALDLATLGVSLVITQRMIASVPAGAVICAFVCSLLVPLRAVGGRSTPWREFLAAVPRRLVTVAATAVLLHYFLVRPLGCLWFGAVWAVVGWLCAVDWKRIADWILGNRWIMNPMRQETLRIALLLFVVLWLMKGFARTTLHGTGDARWYSLNLADAVAQARAGVFPIWVGQSIYQFNGSISPIRIAPGFQYLAVLLDALTLRTLGFCTLQNLLLILLGVGAILTAYLCLSRLVPERKWLAAGLASLFLSCPGVIGIPYNGDLFMSWTTVPFIPVVWFATVQSFRDRGKLGTLVVLAAALGVCWWGHAPIAVWSTLVAAALQIARIALQAAKGIAWGPIAAAALVFSAIAAYPISSVLLYPAEPGYKADTFQSVSAANVHESLIQTFPDSILPITSNGRSQGDFQLGYALWALLIFALWSQRRAWNASSAAPLACAAVLALMLIPLPWVTVAVWNAVPRFARDATGDWPITRFGVLMAGATVFGAAAWASAGLANLDRKRRGQFALLVAAGCAWSFGEALKFDADSVDYVESSSVGMDLFRPENIQLSRYSYGFFPHYPAFPTTYTHGVTDPELENHLLSADMSSSISRNYDAALASGSPIDASSFSWLPAGHPDHAELGQKIRIEPDNSYLLSFTFDHPDELHGVLQISGKHFFREYGLPENGGPRAFGAGGQHISVLPLRTTSGAEDLNIRFFPADPLGGEQAAPPSLGAVQLLTYDRAHLPVRVDGWIPYRAEVRSPEDAWLETPRVFQTGYVATVNHQPAVVKESPEFLVCVAVPKGESTVELAYMPPAGMRASFWISFLSIVAITLLGALRFILHLLGKSYPAKTSDATIGG
jgi:hypothetical protein